MAEFRMPSLGADMEAGTLVEWLVKPGDKVKRGDIVAVVETQKGAIEIEIFETGQIEEILVDLDTKVPVGTPLARIRTEGEAEGSRRRCAESRRCSLSPRRDAHPERRRLSLAEGRPGGQMRASPAARRLAQQASTLSAIKGSGPRRRNPPRRRRTEPGAPHSVEKKRRPVSTSTRCATPLPRRWRVRSAKSRITIFSTRST